MKTKTELFLDLWLEARTRFTNQLQDLTTNDVRKKLLPSQNSVGFLIRHIGDVELLFAKNVFGNANVKVIAKTVSTKYDTGEWTNLEELKQYIDTSYESLKSIIEKQTEADWETNVSTKEFGTKTKAEAFGRIISHTTYHAGQIAIIKKYGTI